MRKQLVDRFVQREALISRMTINRLFEDDLLNFGAGQQVADQLAQQF